MRPRTPPKVLARRRDTTIQATKGIEDVEQTCFKVTYQVSQTWEALMDNEQSQSIASDLTTFK